MKLSKLALYSACIFILSVLTQPVLAADSQTEKATPYQSSFDDYKPLTNENLADWKAINSPSNVGGHSMHGMQMSPEQMTNMPSEKGSPADKSMPAMEGMNHGDMKAMDHSQMKHDQMMAPMEGMDHSKMPSMSHDEMQAMSKHEVPAMQHKDHAAMQGMNRNHPPSTL